MTHLAIVILLVVLVNTDSVTRAEVGTCVDRFHESKTGPVQNDELERLYKVESNDEQAFPQMNSEVLDFRAASESF